MARTRELDQLRELAQTLAGGDRAQHDLMLRTLEDHEDRIRVNEAARVATTVKIRAIVAGIVIAAGALAAWLLGKI